MNHRDLLDESKEILIINKPLAKAIGLHQSIILRQLHYWLGRNTAKLIDGKYWVYNTYKQWCADNNFPFWTEKTVNRHFLALEKQGLVISTSDYNKAKYDNTKWYTIDYDKYEEIMDLYYKNNPQSVDENPQDKMSRPSGQNVPVDQDKMSQPIPKTTTKTTTEREGVPSIFQNEKPTPNWKAPQWIGANDYHTMKSKFRKYDDGKFLDPATHPSEVNAVFYAWLRGLGDKQPAMSSEQLWRENFKQCEQLVLCRITPYEVYSYVTEQYNDAFWSNKVVGIGNVSRNIQAWKAQPTQPNGNGATQPTPSYFKEL